MVRDFETDNSIVDALRIRLAPVRNRQLRCDALWRTSLPVERLIATHLP